MTTYPKRSPLEAIRAFCVECQGGSFQGVTECTDTACAFHPYRQGTALEKGRHSPVRACKRYCTDYCQAGIEEARNCRGDEAILGPCPVFPFRLGKNPNISAATREKRRQATLERGPVGIIATQNSRIHGPVNATESTERSSAGL